MAKSFRSIYERIPKISDSGDRAGSDRCEAEAYDKTLYPRETRSIPISEEPLTSEGQRTMARPTESAGGFADETILDEAKRLVFGDRRAEYDHPFYNWDRTARIWEAILGHTVTPEQAALCMIGTKLARAAFKLKRDSLVDIAGYAEVVDLINNFKYPYDPENQE